jgi:multidrug efflux pump subunit AcrB
MRWRPWRSFDHGAAVVVAAALTLDLTGATMNAVAFAGLLAALALVIDDAIVTIDSILRRLREDGAESTAGAIARASLDVRSASVYATLAVAVAIVPVYFLEQIPGAFFPDAATSYLLALLAALVVSITVTPALAVLLSRKSAVGRQSPLVAPLRRGYGKSLPRMITRPPPLSWARARSSPAASRWPSMGSLRARPTIRRARCRPRWDAAPGTSCPRWTVSRHVPPRNCGASRCDPGRRPRRPVGRAADRGCQLRRAVVRSARARTTGDARVGQERDERYPGLASYVEAFSTDKVRRASGSPATTSTSALRRGKLPVLESTASKLATKIGTIDGVTRARVARPASEPTIKVQVSLDKADKYGLKPGDVRRAAATLLSGTLVGSLFEKQRVFDVVVWGTPQTRRDLTAVRNLLIETPSGKNVRLSQVADVGIAPSPPVIERQAVSRLIDISVSTAGRDRGAVTRDINRPAGAALPPNTTPRCWETPQPRRC